ncbi:MAG: sulfotransferase family protein [Bacteroidota bacterium]
MANPTFIIGGERRSGSTTLYELTNNHPEIDMFHYSDMDFFIESNLFSRSAIKNNEIKQWNGQSKIENYKANFINENKITGQKDADLLWWKPSHKRLAEFLPSTKFVFVLRNPVDRALSQYWNEFRKGRETRSFEEALRYEENHEMSEWEKLHLQYKKRGCYAESLKHFLTYIDSKKCHVIVLEKLKDNKDAELKKLGDFLGVNPIDFKINTDNKVNREEALIINPAIRSKYLVKLIILYDKVVNKIIVKYTSDSKKRTKLRSKFMQVGKKSAREVTKINANLIKGLKEFYKPYNIELEKLIKQNLSEWD